MPPESKDPRPQLVNAGQYMGYGLTWAMSTGLFLVGGWALDRWLGTMPLFLIVGAFVGAGAGFYSIYFHLVLEPRRRDAERARDLRAGGGLPGGGPGEGPR